MEEQANAHVLAADRAGLQTFTYKSRVEWLQARRGVITSTDVGALASLSNWGTPLTVYAEKTSEEAPKEEEEGVSERMMLGTILQNSVARAYQILRKLREGVWFEVEPVPEHVLLVHARNAQHGTSMDCWAWKHEVPQGIPFPLEIKTTSAYPDEPFDDWLTQVQWQMYVTGSHTATIAALCGGDDLRWWDIARDEEVIGALLNAASSFILDHVRPHVPPLSIGTESDRRAMRKLFPMDEGGECVMDAIDMDHVHEIASLKVQIDFLEQEKSQHEDALKAKMGTAALAYLPNGGKITWKSFEKAGYQVKPTVVRPFKIVAPGEGRGRKK